MQTKTALITGAGIRLGRAMALTLAEQGYDIAVHYARSDSGAAEVVDAARALGRTAVVLQADLLDEKATQALLPRAAEALGAPVAVLVNNASVFEFDTFETASRDSWDRHFGSNLRAPFVLTQALAAQAPDPVIDANGEPQAQALVVNMVDHWVQDLAPEFMTYGLAKAGLWTLTQTSAQVLAPRVRANAIGPGPTVQGHRQSPEHFRQQRHNTPLKRGSNPADITAALRYLLNAPAVTGQLLCVDGGLNMGGSGGGYPDQK